jgi:glycosyltransferase involved in cell wall biosynthesis
VSDSLVSIVMPAWRPHPEWLRQAVASALDEQACRVELIVVDDGSPEPVADLLRPLEDPRLRVVRSDHGGVAHARNVGVRAAGGDYFRFVDADDVVARGSTGRLVRVAAAGVIAYGDTAVCDRQLRPLGIKSSDLEGWIARDCLLYRFDVRLMAMLFPRAVVEAVGEWDATLQLGEDWDYVLRALEHAPVRRDPEIALFYRRHERSQTANLEAALRYESLVVDRYIERHPEEAGTGLEREARAKLLTVRGKAWRAMRRSRREQFALMARAFRLHPRRAAEELRREAVLLAKRAGGRLRRSLSA